MGRIPSVKSVSLMGDRYRVVFREEWRMERSKSPKWVQQVAESVDHGAFVDLGQFENTTGWKVQAVEVDAWRRDREDARNLATRIVKRIERGE